ncbi:MAG TPA: signal peptidase I [Candidatus Angelobacter sp.]|nr:signal peptidase I [Candidatus Angelobacter sp.]
MPLFKKKKSEKPEKPKETLPEFISGIAEVLVTGLFIITFVVQSFVIPSGSMENTLLIGDHLFVDRLAPALKAGFVGPLVPYRPIRHGDIIVFIHPDPAEGGIYVVKRVIGIPGDRIHLHNGVVYRNGVALNEPYVIHQPGASDLYRDEFPKYPVPTQMTGVPSTWPIILHDRIRGDDVVVPDDDYFGMGDNRDNSLDSRYWGFIPRENIVGRPLLIYWSFDGDYSSTAMSDRVGSFFQTVLHFFDKTRWGRTFRMVR